VPKPTTVSPITIGDRPKTESAIRRLAGIGRGKGDNAADNHDAILYDELQR